MGDLEDFLTINSNNSISHASTHAHTNDTTYNPTAKNTHLISITKLSYHSWIKTDQLDVTLGSCDRASWGKYEERKTNKMQQLDVYY
jgi:hypothetical protein